MKDYVSPLVERYASPEMSAIFSPDRRYRTWRRLWVALARAERKLGLKISAEQVRDLEAFRDTVDYARVADWEKRLRHDVMAHLKHYAELAKKAAPILHLGATSMYVVDNADLILMREALDRVILLLVNVIDALKKACLEHRRLAIVGYTHYQPAQLTTLGKRLSLWLSDLVVDLREAESVRGEIRFLGSRGAVGTQASYLELFDGDESKARRLDELIAAEFGFEETFGVTGQTYSRKIDARTTGALASIAQSAHKAGMDLRLMQNLMEVAEPFGSDQVGSSAMPYKQNPMQAERMGSLARLVISLQANQAHTAATQWLERTLDDSAGKRIAIPEAFLATDGILNLYLSIVSGLQVRKQVIESNVRTHFPFIATENILMHAARSGGDRQALHEAIRAHSLKAWEEIVQGRENDLIERLKSVPALKRALEARPALLEVDRYVGRAPAQVEEFVRREVEPILKRYRKCLGVKPAVRV
jgi:adenylosuccinate lyase